MQNGRKGSHESRVTLGRAVVSEQGASGPSLWLTFALELLGSAAPRGAGQGPTPEWSHYPNVLRSMSAF